MDAAALFLYNLPSAGLLNTSGPGVCNQGWHLPHVCSSGSGCRGCSILFWPRMSHPSGMKIKHLHTCPGECLECLRHTLSSEMASLRHKMSQRHRMRDWLAALGVGARKVICHPSSLTRKPRMLGNAFIFARNGPGESVGALPRTSKGQVHLSILHFSDTSPTAHSTGEER